MKKYLLAASMAVSLAACAQPSGPSYADIAAAAKVANDKLAACNQAVLERPEYARTGLQAVTASGAQLADDSYPSPERAKASLASWDDSAPCRQAFLAALGSPPINNHTNAVQLYSDFYYNVALLQAEYSKGKMTVSEHTRKSKELFDTLNSRLNAAEAQLQQAQAQAAQVRAQNAAAALAVWGAMQPQRVQVQMCNQWGCY